nr:PREDICTED: uncharacterized protein LOC109030766 [Bemisia tabaci]
MKLHCMLLTFMLTSAACRVRGTVYTNNWLRYLNPLNYGTSWFQYLNPFHKTSPTQHHRPNLTASPGNTSKNVDKVFDYMLGKVRTLLVNAGQRTISIPDISEPFQKLGIQGQFRSWNGSFEDLSTIYRTGDIQADVRPASLRVRFSVGLKDALLRYENYHIRFLNVGPDGRLAMKISDNSLNVDVTVSYNPKVGISRSCKVKLNRIRLDKFDGVQVDMTGLGPFNWGLNMVSRWALGALQTDIKDKFESVIKSNLQSVLDYGDLCRKLRTG